MPKEKQIEQFFDDMKILSQEIQRIDAEIFSLYDVLENEHHDFLKELNQICQSLNLQASDTMLMALLERLVQLKENAIIQELKKEGFTKERIEEIKEALLTWVITFYTNRHQRILNFLKERRLLNAFYRCIFEGVHVVGLAMNVFFSQWQKDIFINFYESLRAQKSHEEILEILQETMERYQDSFADRSYSVLREDDGGFVKLSYGEAFRDCVDAVIKALDDLLFRLEGLQDPLFGQEDAYMQYFLALKRAFLQKDCEKLIGSWQDVDRCWMQITSPLQIAHPLEYYEDRYRHCVAPEWDLRLCHQDNNTKILKSIRNCFVHFAKKIHLDARMMQENLQDLSKIQSYDCVFALFYGSQHNGLFSAQVVPNDEIVTRQYGKKIFAFPSRIIQMARNKPKMRLSYEIFGEAIMQESLDLLFSQESLWYQIYAISTNGHEYGHMLWMEEDTQVLMNKSGHFKNIEEFKATCGGLVAYFLQEDYALLEPLMLDHLMRCVGLLAYREQEDILPYYYESLLHLYGGFESGVLEWRPQDNIKLCIHKENFKLFITWYLKIYEDLALHYKDKKDAILWLERFMNPKEKQLFLKDADGFVRWYDENYKQRGREILN